MTVLSVLSSGLILFGLLSMTLSVVGLWLVPDRCIKVHIATKGLVLGLGVLIGGAALTHLEELGLRSGIVVLALFVTTPVASHALIRMELNQKTGAEQQRPGEAQGR